MTSIERRLRDLEVAVERLGKPGAVHKPWYDLTDDEANEEYRRLCRVPVAAPLSHDADDALVAEWRARHARTES